MCPVTGWSPNGEWATYVVQVRGSNAQQWCVMVGKEFSAGSRPIPGQAELTPTSTHQRTLTITDHGVDRALQASRGVGVVEQAVLQVSDHPGGATSSPVSRFPANFVSGRRRRNHGVCGPSPMTINRTPGTAATSGRRRTPWRLCRLPA